MFVILKNEYFKRFYKHLDFKRTLCLTVLSLTFYPANTIIVLKIRNLSLGNYMKAERWSISL